MQTRDDTVLLHAGIWRHMLHYSFTFHQYSELELPELCMLIDLCQHGTEPRFSTIKGWM